jgi:UDP-glucose 4-epimerase
MKKSNKKTIMVTGALGHIGSELIRSFSSKTVDTIILLDNMKTQRYPSLFNLPDTFNYTFLEEDICKVDLRTHLNGVDVLVHLAALTDAESSHGREKEVEAVNLDGLRRVADACLEKNVKIIFPSTTSVYGSQAEVVDENCRELKPQSPYAQSKIAAEDYLRSLKGEGLDFVICRFGTIFGRSVGMRFHTAVNKFVWQAVNGSPITVWKTAWEQKRPYLDLQDCVRAINLIIEKDIFDGDVYNVLTKNFTVKDIVTTIQTFVPGLSVQYVDSVIMNQLSYDVDNSKFAKKGFIVKGDLRRGISETIALLKGILRS